MSDSITVGRNLGQTHPLLFAVRDLLRREMDNIPAYVVSEQLDYAKALGSLCDSLHDHEQAVVVFTPGFVIRRTDGGHSVDGWSYVLLLPDGRTMYPRGETSWHYYRWRARWAGRSWVKRARAVTERIATEMAAEGPFDLPGELGQR